MNGKSDRERIRADFFIDVADCVFLPIYCDRPPLFYSNRARVGGVDFIYNARSVHFLARF